MHINTTMWYHFISARMAIIKSLQTINAGEGMVKRESYYTVSGNVNWCYHCGKQYGGSSKQLKLELLFDPAIPLLEIYLERTMTRKYTCIPMFIAALYTIAKIWKQPKCLTEEWIKKMWYIYTMEYYSAI